MLILITLENKGVKLGFSVGKSNSFSQLNFLTNQSLFDFSIEEYTLSYDSNTRSYNTTIKELQYDN